MIELNVFDVTRAVRMLPSEVRCALESKKCFLAGGYIRAVIANETVNDIDLFVSTKADADDLVKFFQSKCDCKSFKTKNAVTLTGMKHVVQIIHRWTFDTPAQCIESFDFTIACSAIWYDREQVGFFSMCDDLFYQDLAAKRLVYRNPVRNEDAGGSMLRLLKFYRAGYTGPLQTIADVMSRITSGVRDDCPRDAVSLSRVFLGLLREVDPLKVDGDEDA